MKTFDKIKKKKAEQEKEEADKYFKEFQTECAPIADEILKMIANADLNVKSIGAEGKTDEFYTLCENIMKLLLEKNVKKLWWHSIFQLVVTPAESVKNTVIESLTTSYNDGIARIFGAESMDYLRMQDIDAKFIEHANSVQSAGDSATTEGQEVEA